MFFIAPLKIKWLLPFFSIMLFGMGCQPISILLLKRNNNYLCPNYVSTKDAFFQVKSCLNLPDIKSIVEDTQITRIDIISSEKNQKKIKSMTINLDTKIASINKRNKMDSITLDDINRIILYEHNPIKKRKEEALTQFICWSLIGVLFDMARLTSHKEPIPSKKLIGIPYLTIGGITLGIGFGSLFLFEKDVWTKKLVLSGFKEIY